MYNISFKLNKTSNNSSPSGKTSKKVKKPKINEGCYKLRRISFKTGLPTENRNENISRLLIIYFLFVFVLRLNFQQNDLTELTEFRGFD